VLFREELQPRSAEKNLQPLQILWCPAISIRPKKFKIPKGSFDFLLITSSNALRFVRSRPKVKTVIAIGEKTSESIRLKNGEKIKILKDSHSDGVAQFFEKQVPSRILYLRGSLSKKLGDKNLIKKIKACGHRVQTVETYQTKILSVKRRLRKILSRNKVDGFFLTSPSTVEAIRKSFSLREIHSWKCSWVAIGPTTSKAIRKLRKVTQTAKLPTLISMKKKFLENFIR
jgi:uroporphyrinogen-III synthase